MEPDLSILSKLYLHYLNLPPLLILWSQLLKVLEQQYHWWICIYCLCVFRCVCVCVIITQFNKIIDITKYPELCPKINYYSNWKKCRCSFPSRSYVYGFSKLISFFRDLSIAEIKDLAFPAIWLPRGLTQNHTVTCLLPQIKDYWRILSPCYITPSTAWEVVKLPN